MQNQSQHGNGIPESTALCASSADTRVGTADAEKWLKELLIPLLVQKFIDTQMSAKEKENE